MKPEGYYHYNMPAPWLVDVVDNEEVVGTPFSRVTIRKSTPCHSWEEEVAGDEVYDLPKDKERLITDLEEHLDDIRRELKTLKESN